MNTEERMDLYREWITRLACAIYNEEGWDKQVVIGYFEMGDKSLDYDTRGIPNADLTPDDVIGAIDRIFTRAGI